MQQAGFELTAPVDERQTDPLTEKYRMHPAKSVFASVSVIVSQPFV